MKTNKLFKTISCLTAIAVILTWSNCNPPDMVVDQPEFTSNYATFRTMVNIFSRGG